MLIVVDWIDAGFGGIVDSRDESCVGQGGLLWVRVDDTKISCSCIYMLIVVVVVAGYLIMLYALFYDASYVYYY